MAVQTLPQGPTQGPKPQPGSSGQAAVPPQTPAGHGSREGDRPAPPPARQRVAKFRVLAGDAIEDQLNWLPRERVLAYAEEAGIADADRLSDQGRGGLSPLRQAVRATRIAERRWKAGQIIASPRPLSSRWPEKYGRVGDEVPESPGEPTLRRANDEVEESYSEAAQQQSFDAELSQDDLHRMNVGQLRELAYHEGIDLGSADAKASILATIRRQRRAIAEDR